MLLADDDGFVNNTMGIIRLCGCSKESLVELIKNGYVIPFVSGVVCITHWKEHNWLCKEKYHPSILEEKQYVIYLKGGIYGVLEKYKDRVSYLGNQVKIVGKDTDGSHLWPAALDQCGISNADPDGKWQPGDKSETEEIIDV
jgi:hypothetical protein